MRSRATLLLLLAGALLGACTAPAAGSPKASSPSPTLAASNPPSVAGGPMIGSRTFVSTSVTGRDLVPGTAVTLRFNDGQLGAYTGCNSMSGGYHITGNTLYVEQMATTEMGCRADLMAQDQWLAAFLPGATTDISAAGLTLAKDNVTMTLVDQQTTNLLLEGRYWAVDGLVSGDAVSSVPQGVKAILKFVDGRIEVRAGCNQGSGTATVADGTITFGAIALTKMACSSDAMAVEKHVTAVLAGVQPYAIAGDSLTIGASGKDGLTLMGSVQPETTPNPGPS